MDENRRVSRENPTERGKRGERLTLRERAFIAFFKGNATEAAVHAGYKQSAARVIGSRLLAKPAIREAIDRGMASAAQRVKVERGTIMSRLWELASLPPEATANNIGGQVRAADTLAEILGMKVQRTADLTKHFDGRTEEELEFFAQHGFWPESVDAAESSTSGSEGLRQGADKPEKIN